MSPQLVHVLTVSREHSNSHLHEAARRALKALEAFLATADQALQLSILDAVREAAGGLQQAKMLPKLIQVQARSDMEQNLNLFSAFHRTASSVTALEGCYLKAHQADFPHLSVPPGLILQLEDPTALKLEV